MIVDVTARERRHIRVTGIVQGVGFRPFVHRLATELGLDGFVGNDSAGVVIEVDGDPSRVALFLDRLPGEAPPLSRLDSITSEGIEEPTRAGGFTIVESESTAGRRTLVPPDVATCDDCVAEALDPSDRRYRYPFTNCTNCGPRFTIIRDLPYDRAATTMAAFAMCADCAAEYTDPGDRRYHAQPIACPRCGPQVMWERNGEAISGTDHVVAEFHRSIARGEIVAVKGIGGYHLVCDATNEAALGRLRARKGRIDKPFAVMAADLHTAASLIRLTDTEIEALKAPARPIVLAPRRRSSVVDAVAPGNPLLGVMLPYSPLHHLLLARAPGVDTPPPQALVMTSGNRSNEPICFEDDDARSRLADLADAFLFHDRPIQVPCDDSVVRVVGGEVLPIRRSRGFAPVPVALPVQIAPTLAVGAELKNTFCLADQRHAWVGPHVGDMENLETLHAFERGVDGFTRMYDVQPERLAADLHPGYLTRRWASERADGHGFVEVQHHHAHVAALMAEHGLDGSRPILGVAFDGTGFGRSTGGDVQIWGGEFLLADYDGYERLGHLAPLPLPGGDDAIRNPCRIAVAYLAASGLDLDPAIPAVAACDATERRVVAQQVARNVGCIPTTSMGRLFDAVASLIGVRHRITYEAQAAIEMEALADAGVAGSVDLAFGVSDSVLDPHPILLGLLDALSTGAAPADLALAFHMAVADALAKVAIESAADRNLDTVALTGGVFQNALLTRLSQERFDATGLRVLTHRLVPPNDGGVSLGQAIIAGRKAAVDERT